MSLTLTGQVLKKFKRNRIFIECGTYAGDGVQLAKDCGFDTIYTIEISPRLHKHSYDRAYHPNRNGLNFLLGDTTQVLPGLLKTINEPCTFWLDAHFPQDGASHVPTWSSCPTILELGIIAAHPIKAHTILIDDIPDFKSGIHDHITVDQLLAAIREINPNYQISYEDGNQPGSILVATLP
jgi:hypothetical protein